MGWTVQTHPLAAWEQTQLNLSHGSTQQHEQAWQQHKQDVTLIGCPAGKQLPSKSRLASAPSEASVGCGLSLRHDRKASVRHLVGNRNIAAAKECYNCAQHLPST